MPELIEIRCIPDTDPQMIYIEFAGIPSYAIPYTFYDIIREPLGLPHIACGPNAE